MKRALLVFIILTSLLSPQHTLAGFWMDQQHPLVVRNYAVSDSTRKVPARRDQLPVRIMKTLFTDPYHHRSGWPGITSLICGIFGLFFFPAIAAIILGSIGFEPDRKFRWMAWVGLRLGIFFLFIDIVVIIILLSLV